MAAWEARPEAIGRSMGEGERARDSGDGHRGAWDRVSV